MVYASHRKQYKQTILPNQWANQPSRFLQDPRSSRRCASRLAHRSPPSCLGIDKKNHPPCPRPRMVVVFPVPRSPMIITPPICKSDDAQKQPRTRTLWNLVHQAAQRIHATVAAATAAAAAAASTQQKRRGRARGRLLPRLRP